MELARAPLSNHGGVPRRDVADVRRKPVHGIERVHAPHRAVADNLRDDRRRGNRGALLVSVDDGAVGRRRGAEPETVDETCLGGRRERGESSGERAQVRAMQAEAIDLAGGHRLNGDAGGAGEDSAEDLLALVRAELLRVVQETKACGPTTAHESVVEQHPRGDERPGEASPPRLVGPCDKANAESAVESEKLLETRRHAAEDSAYACRFSRTRAFFPTFERR